MLLLLPLALIIAGEPIAPPRYAPVGEVAIQSCGSPRASTSAGPTAPPLWLAAATGPSRSAAITVSTQDRAQPLELWRADDGLFYVDGVINGQPIRFVVDTGASMVVLTAQDARRARIEASSDTSPVVVETVGGRNSLRRVTLETMQVGSTGVTAAPAVVAGEGLSVSLLGQSWLAQLASVTIEGDRMILRQ